MECPFVFSSSAEIPVFCPREQCPLHVFSLESSRVVSSFTVLAQGDPFVLSLDNLPLGHPSSGVSPEFHKSDCFSQKHLDDTPFSSFPLPFVCPYLLSSCFIYPISTLPEHLHSTSLSYAETTLNSRKLVSFPLIAHYLSAGPPLPPTPPFTGRPGHTHT